LKPLILSLFFGGNKADITAGMVGSQNRQKFDNIAPEI